MFHCFSEPPEILIHKNRHTADLSQISGMQKRLSFYEQKTQLSCEIKFRRLPDWIEMLMWVIVLVRNLGSWFCENRNFFRQRKNREIIFKGNLSTRTNTEGWTFVRFRLRVFILMQECLLISGLRTKKFTCRKVLARLYGQEQQIKTENKTKNFHWFQLKFYYKSFALIQKKTIDI